MGSTIAEDWRQAATNDTPLRAGLNAVRQATGDTGYRQRASTVDPADAAVYAAQGRGATPGRQAASGGLDPEQVLASSRAQFSQPSTGSLPVSGVNLARGAEPGKQVFNFYNPDAAPTGNNPWQDMARQLATFSALRARGPDGPTGGMIADGRAADREALFDKWDRQNAQAGLQRDLSGARTQSQRQAILGAAGLANQADMAQLQAGTARRGQDMGLISQQLQQQSHLQGIDRQIAGQQGVASINAQSHLQGIDLQGRNQAAVAERQGQNQLANTRLHYDLANQGGLDLERERQNSPEVQARADYYRAGAEANKAHAGLYTAQQAQRGTPDMKGIADMLTAISAIPGFDPQRNPQHAQLLNHLLAPVAGGQGQAQNGAPHAEGTQLRGKDGNLYVVKNGQPVPVHGYAEGGLIDDQQPRAGMIAAPQTQLTTMTMKERDAANQQASMDMRNNVMRGIAALGSSFGQLGGGVATSAAPNNNYSMASVSYKPGQSTFGFADGGPVDVGGQQVLGQGTGKSDSLPAVIDEEHPAQLSTGEFVMPVEAVQHFGVEKLNKMVAQARKGRKAG